MPVKMMLSKSRCWEVAKVNGKGYSYTWINGRLELTHRVAYQSWKGEIPEGLTVDHLCRNRACINPDHLEAVTGKENTQRGDAGKITGARQKAKTHCPKGHEYTLDNTYQYRYRNSSIRECRTCHKLRERNRRQKYAGASLQGS